VDGRDKPGDDESGGETAAIIASASAQRPSCLAHAAIQHVAAFRIISDVAEYWIVRWSRSSGAHSRDPVADDDGSEFGRRRRAPAAQWHDGQIAHVRYARFVRRAVGRAAFFNPQPQQAIDAELF